MVEDPISNGAVIIPRAAEDRLILTVECIGMLLDKVKTIVSRLEKQKAQIDLKEQYRDEKVRKIEKDIGKLLRWTEAICWFQALKEHSSLPKGGKMQELEAGTIGIYLNQELLENHKTKILVALNIKWGKGTDC